MPIPHEVQTHITEADPKEPHPVTNVWSAQLQTSPPHQHPGSVASKIRSEANKIGKNCLSLIGGIWRTQGPLRDMVITQVLVFPVEPKRCLCVWDGELTMRSQDERPSAKMFLSLNLWVRIGGHRGMCHPSPRDGAVV